VTHDISVAIAAMAMDAQRYIYILSQPQHIKQSTVFPRIDAAAFIYFVGQFGAATIRGRCLFEGGVYSFWQYDPRRVPRLRPQHPAEVLSTKQVKPFEKVWLLQKPVEK